MRSVVNLNRSAAAAAASCSSGGGANRHRWLVRAVQRDIPFLFETSAVAVRRALSSARPLPSEEEDEDYVDPNNSDLDYEKADKSDNAPSSTTSFKRNMNLNVDRSPLNDAMRVQKEQQSNNRQLLHQFQRSTTKNGSKPSSTTFGSPLRPQPQVAPTVPKSSTGRLNLVPPPVPDDETRVPATKDDDDDAADDETTQRQDPNREEDALPLSPSALTYTGGTSVPITSRLRIVSPRNGDDAPRGIWPVFRLMDESGHFRDPAYDYDAQPNAVPSFDPTATHQEQNTTRDLDTLRKHLQDMYPVHADEIERCGLLHPSKFAFTDMATSTDKAAAHNPLMRAYTQMHRLRQMDFLLLNAQRQGRISFYMTCRGEEAIHFGAASALERDDPIMAQYREQGVLMWRGFSLEQFTNQCYSNDMDLGKGRQMPVHYGSRALNYHTISSPLGTQLPQAVGAAYKLKLDGKPNVVACFFGDGCASTTDFHCAMNFAATLHAPVLFICRNNGYAISTPVTDQYAGDGIVSRAPGYGMAGIRVDGNDMFAVHAAVREAKAYAVKHSAPVLIECMTYRQGHHSTSDDSTRYRSADEVNEYASHHDPLKRISMFLTRQGWLSADEQATIQNSERLAVLHAMKAAEHRPKPSVDALFTDVYHSIPKHLQEQQAQLHAHMAKYPKKYNK